MSDAPGNLRLIPRCLSRASVPAIRQHFKDLCAYYEKRALGAPFGLTKFSVHFVTLRPGLVSTERRRHTE